MIFTPEHIDKINRGLKTQTRRLVREGEQVLFEYVSPYTTYGPVVCPVHAMELPLSEVYHIIAVLHANGRTKWEIGRDYAMQPGRTAKAVGRIPELTSIRLQRLQDISEADAVKEGCVRDDHMITAVVSSGARIYTASYKFAQLWDSINPRKADRWAENPLVWALGWKPEVSDGH